jgi:hypothetical protein
MCGVDGSTIARLTRKHNCHIFVLSDNLCSVNQATGQYPRWQLAEDSAQPFSPLMANLIDDAIEALRQTPEDVQAPAVRAILDYNAGQDDNPRLTDEQVVEIEHCITKPDCTFRSLDNACNHRRPSG